MPRPLIVRERPAKAAQFVCRRRQRVQSATGALRITMSPIILLVSILCAFTVAKH